MICPLNRKINQGISISVSDSNWPFSSIPKTLTNNVLEYFHI